MRIVNDALLNYIRIGILTKRTNRKKWLGTASKN
jgi:hypothetical protein